MLYQTNKKGISIFIGYVLLVSFVIVISIIVYQVLKTYVPSDIQSCPDGASIILKEYVCDDRWLNITVKNNGLFNIGGIFVHVSTQENIELPTRDLSLALVGGGIPIGNSIAFDLSSENSLTPGNEQVLAFDLYENGFETAQIMHLGLTAIRFEEINGKTKFVSCGNTIINQPVDCPEIMEGGGGGEPPPAA